MPYCTYTDVQSEFKDITFTTATKVTPAEVAEFIVQADALIDTEIGSRYIVPVTANTTTVSLLKSISIALVRERILPIIATKTGDDETTQDPSKKNLINPLKLLERIAKGDLKLAGATETSSNGVSSYAVDHKTKHVFKKGCDQW